MRDGWRERTLAEVLWYRERQQSFVLRLFWEVCSTTPQAEGKEGYMTRTTTESL
ncbi:unnamed protein product, partial [Ectocarpus sp. 8 AP-2014]